MTKQTDFIEQIQQGYQAKVPAIKLGTAMLGTEAIPNTFVNLVVKSFNRHGLIAGATGTGKTKTLQFLAESLSHQGIPSLMLDIKGDLSGLAMLGETKEAITQRQELIGETYQPQSFPVEFLSLSQEPGVQLRATVEEFGPLLFSQLLELNDVQSGILTVLFKYCEDNQIPLIDLNDLKAVFQFAMGPGGDVLEKNYGKLSSNSITTILRKVVELEQQGADQFFGEPSFDVQDLLQLDNNGHATVSILRVTDLQDKPKLFSTFMLGLLSEVYRTFPEVGDPDKPKLVIFIDEAHLVFNEASKALLDKIETMVKLIRSKAVGIMFCTQSPTDIPADVLGQLGLKIQHALRAFTAKDRKAIKLAAENYPSSEFYKTEDVVTELGIGEALVTALDEKGRPTPLVRALLQAPRSRMGVLSASELQTVVSRSQLVRKYANRVQRQPSPQLQTQSQEAEAPVPRSSGRAEPSIGTQIVKSSLLKNIVMTILREVIRAFTRRR